MAYEQCSMRLLSLGPNQWASTGYSKTQQKSKRRWWLTKMKVASSWTHSNNLFSIGSSNHLANIWNLLLSYCLDDCSSAFLHRGKSFFFCKTFKRYWDQGSFSPNPYCLIFISFCCCCSPGVSNSQPAGQMCYVLATPNLAKEKKVAIHHVMLWVWHPCCSPYYSESRKGLPSSYIASHNPAVVIWKLLIWCSSLLNVKLKTTQTCLPSSKDAKQPNVDSPVITTVSRLQFITMDYKLVLIKMQFFKALWAIFLSKCLAHLLSIIQGQSGQMKNTEN